MTFLRAEGFDQLVRDVALEAAGHVAVEDAVRHASSMGGRFPSRLGLQSLTRVESHLLEVAASHHARLGTAQNGADHVVMSGTGRVRLLRGGEAISEETHMLGAITWPYGRPSDLDGALDHREDTDRTEAEDMILWLRDLPHDRVLEMIRRVRFSLLHMAPVVLYSGNRSFTNLGKRSNLTGKSLKPGSDRCVLTTLESQPVEAWDVESACFLVCLHELICSGPAVRAEEFSGTQLRPDRLFEFLCRRISDYGADVPHTAGMATGEALHVLASRCATARSQLVASGGTPYRLIEGLTLNKQERIEFRPPRLDEVPAGVLEEVAEQLDVSRVSDFDELSDAVGVVMPRLMEPADGEFSTGFERALHQITMAATEATHSDVGMTRGPRRVAELAGALLSGSTDPLLWTTKDFFCCVTPSAEFVELFKQAPEQLAPVLRSISSRMRYNGWHYLPDTMGMTQSGVREDWFFAPTMADVTDWSNQHHTGHVANGVRHAIRVPFGIDVAGVHRPGMHDFRLMRTTGATYRLEDLRTAVAVAKVLRCLYQANVSYVEREPRLHCSRSASVIDFDNGWYSARHTPNTTRI